jgi:hypothetical protein
LINRDAIYVRADDFTPEEGRRDGKGLTAEQRKHLEKSLKDNDELMKCLDEM